MASAIPFCILWRAEEGERNDAMEKLEKLAKVAT